MYALLFIPAITLIVILAVSIAPIFDFRRRPLPGSMGTCAFEPEPVPAALPVMEMAA